MNKIKVLLRCLLVGLVAISVFAPSTAKAVRPTSLKATLSDSRPSTASNWTITLDQSASTQLASGETVTITFPTGFSIASLGIEDLDFKVAATDETLQTAACGATDTVQWAVSSQVLTFTACSSYTTEAASAVIEIEVGTNATSGAAGDTQVSNSTAANYTVTAAGTYGDDSQDTLIVIVAGVTVSATIDEALTFSINAVTNTNCPTTGGTKVTSTATTVPFATISTEAFYDICQDLRMATNAGGGYTVTTQTTAGLDSGANAFAVGSCDGSCTLTTPNTWATATNNGYAIGMQDQATYGDAAATANAGWDTAGEQLAGATQKFELVADVGASDVASTIMSSAAGVADDRSYVGWRISASATQPAGAYTGTAVYIATGTF